MDGDTSLHQLVFVAEGLDPGVARVRRVIATEEVSASYRAEIDIEIIEQPVEPAAWLHKSALLGVARGADGKMLRRFGGVVTRVREQATRGGKQQIRVTLESPWALLELTRDFRIYQQMKTKDIVAAMLKDAGIADDKTDWRLSGSYPEREVTTQLGETCAAFAMRLLEEDGIFFFFEHGEDAVKIVFGDSPSAWATTTPEDEIPFMPMTGLISTQAISHIWEAERARPAKVTLRDHDFKKPALDLEAKASGEAPLDREHYDHPGRYVDPAVGKKRAQARLDALTAAAKGVQGQSSVFSLTPGHAFTLTGAKNADLDKAWVIVELVTVWDDSGGAARYQNDFRAVEKAATYRPPQRAPRARAPGPTLAIVTGPKGEEIHTDEHGRVKVYFPWDRRSTKDDKSSAWIRVGQMHTSGSVAIPRVGWEVMVDFEDGDPDRPIVLGRLYNGIYPPPYQLPGKKTTSSLKSMSSPGGAGHNEIRMDDGAGGEHMHVHAEKDWNINVANNRTEKVTTNANVSVGSNEKITVGASETLQVGAKYEVSVGASQTWSVGASRTVNVTGAETITITGDRSMTIGGSHTTMTPKTVNHTTPATFSETVGGSCLEAAALGVGMAVAGTCSVTVGGVKVEACATGKGDTTLGAQATTVGGAFICASGKDAGIDVGGAKATTVGGAWAANAGSDLNISADGTLKFTVGGVAALTAASLTLKVGGSKVTMSGGAVVIKSSEIKLTATGPQPELAPMVEDK